MRRTSEFRDCYIKLLDGTIKMIDPFTGTVVRVNKERAARLPTEPEEKKPIEPEYRCHFCPGNEFMTPPEKSRAVIRDGEYVVYDRLDPSTALTDTNWQFRRIPNLFEIVSFEYWEKIIITSLLQGTENGKNAIYLQKLAGHIY